MRLPIATGNIPNYPLTPIVDTRGKVMGVAIQNVSPVDFFTSPDANTLQQTDANNLPTVGHHFWPDASPGFVLILPYFRGKLYARAQFPGAFAEVTLYEICPPPPEVIAAA